MSSLASKIEAILYLKAQPLTVAKIAEYARCDRETIEEGLLELMSDYAHRDSALEVVETPNGYCLQLRETFHDLIQQLIPVDLGVGALRTLAAIALKGSLTQTHLIELRGSGAYQHVQELVSLGFVRKRRQSDGRSYWLQVTEKFYQYFQVEQLPQPFDRPRGTAPASSEPDLADSELESELEIDEPGIDPAPAELSQLSGQLPGQLSGPPLVESLAGSGLLQP